MEIDEHKKVLVNFDEMHQSNAMLQQAIDRINEQNAIERENEKRSDKLFNYLLVILGAIAGGLLTLIVDHFL